MLPRFIAAGISVLAFTGSALAAEPKACGKDYVNSQISACPTRTAFCSSFLRTQAPTPTVTSVTTSRTTTISKSVVTDFTATVTSYSDRQIATCPPIPQRGKRSELEERQFGSRCNVNGIQPNKVESACSCLSGFTYSGKRPRATTTQTVTRTTVEVSKTVTTTTVSVGPTETLTRLWLFARYGDGDEAGERLPGWLAQYPSSDQFYLTNNDSTTTGQDFFIRPGQNYWLTAKGTSQRDYEYFNIFGKSGIPGPNAGPPTAVKINLSNPGQKPAGTGDNAYSFMLGIVSSSSCPTWLGYYQNPPSAIGAAPFYLCTEPGTGVRYLYTGQTWNLGGCLGITLEAATSFSGPPSK